MKTEQEQIMAIADVLCDYCKNNTKIGEPCKSSNGTCICTSEVWRAGAIVQAGYGDVSEYKAEIERLKAETSNIRKDTAKEILQTLYDECYEINDETGEGMGNFVSDDDILCLAKHYGVEVDV